MSTSKAGEALLNDMRAYHDKWGTLEPDIWDDYVSARLPAIEAEARAASVADLRTLLDIIDSINDCHGCFDLSGSEEERETVERIRAAVEASK